VRDGLRIARDTLLYARYERQVVRALAATVVVGEADARVLERMAGRPVHVIPNGVGVTEGNGTATAVRPTLAFTGALDYPPNIDAIRFFVEDIWPIVRASVGNARLIIAGRNPDPTVRALATRPGIKIRANVPDMRRVLRDAWVAVAPMRSGSGIKNKVLEAWAEGRPVVMTRQATNGLTLHPETEPLVADSPADFAQRVIALLEHPDRAHAIGQAMRQVVCRNHRWKRAAERLSEILTRTAARR
jgi:glycosyltransferase involved in cell wall biosynthesis